MKRILAISLALAAAPALAGGYAEWLDARLETVVRDTETGARAKVRYFNDVPVGGEEQVVGEDGESYTLNWDGWAGAFEVEIIEGKAGPGFVREAVAAACPSVDKALLAKADIFEIEPGFFQFFGDCPAIPGVGEN